MKTKLFAVILACAYLLAACAAEPVPTTVPTTEAVPETTQPPVTAVPEATEATEPDDGSFKMYYDDHTPVSELTGSEPADVQITGQRVTSRAPGGVDPDSAVLVYEAETKRLIATGTGTATVVADGTAYSVTVRPAPISLFLITGSSSGVGQEGNALQSVLCEEGQVYSTRLSDPLPLPLPGLGLGSSAASRPESIDAFVTPGTGRIGVDGALADRWNQLTGEKVWVLNAAVGGSCINEWVNGTENLNNAASLLSSAQLILTNEIAAGHYTLKDTVNIYFSAGNFAYKNVTFTSDLLRSWYDSMWTGYQRLVTRDVNLDGENETMDYLCFVPGWLNTAYDVDKPATFFMSSSAEFPQYFTATTCLREWKQDLNTFPAIDYTTHGAEVSRPLTMSELYAPDNVHVRQPAYNAMGQNIAEGIYSAIRKKAVTAQVTLLDADGLTVGDTRTIAKGATACFTCLTDVGTVGDLTFTVTGSLTLNYPLEITATGEGTGTLTINRGDTVLKTITFEIK